MDDLNILLQSRAIASPANQQVELKVMCVVAAVWLSPVSKALPPMIKLQ